MANRHQVVRGERVAAAALATIAACAISLSAQEPRLDSVTTLEDVVVTVSRSPETTRSLTASVDVVHRSEVELALTNTADGALRSLPSVNVVGDGAFGQEVRLNLRGLNSGFGTQRTLILLDGRPLTDEFLGTTDLTQYPLASFDRIELVRGPASAAYGSNAMSGVVNLLPVRGALGTRAEAGVEGGTYGTIIGSGLLARGFGKFDAMLSASAQSTDGYLENSRGLPMDWDGRSAFVNVGYGGGRARARLYGLYFKGLATDEDFRRTSHRFSQDLDLGLDFDPAHEATANLRLWYAHLSQDYDWFDQPDADYAQYTVGAIATQRYSAGPLLGLIAGAEVRQQDALVVDGAGTVDEATTLWGVFLQNRMTLGATTTLLLGVRGDGRPAGGVEPSLRAGANVALDAGTTLLAAVGRAFRLPTISDRFLPRTSFFGLEFEGNPDLGPESATSVELGVLRVVGSATMRVTGFLTDARDFWDFLPGEDGVFRPENIARVEAKGFEAEVRTALGARLEARASYTFTDARYGEFTGNEVVEGNRIDDNVMHAGSLGVVWTHPAGHAVQVATRAMGNRVTDPLDLPSTRLPGFAVVDLTTAWSLTSQLRLHFGVLNLLDKSYRLRPEFTQPERAFILGLRVAWTRSGSGG